MLPHSLLISSVAAQLPLLQALLLVQLSWRLPITRGQYLKNSLWHYQNYRLVKLL